MNIFTASLSWLPFAARHNLTTQRLIEVIVTFLGRLHRGP